MHHAEHHSQVASTWRSGQPIPICLLLAESSRHWMLCLQRGSYQHALQVPGITEGVLELAGHAFKQRVRYKVRIDQKPGRHLALHQKC